MTLAVVEAESPRARLEKVVADAGLEPTTKASLIESFFPDFEMAWNASVKALEISVTDPSQTAEIKRAREMRMELRDVRITAEKRRVALKADSLKRGQAIDKVAGVIKAICEPAEAKLLEMETIAERLEKERRAKLKAEREDAMRTYGVDTLHIDLGAMEQPAFDRLLESSRLAHEARAKTEREAKAKREQEERDAAAERERLKAENDRLRREAEQRDAEAKREREAREKLEREARERAVAEKQRADDEARAKRKAARAPIATRIRNYAVSLEALEKPSLPDEVVGQFNTIVGDCLKRLRAFAEELER